MYTLPQSLRIGVLRGGPSDEYDVSLQTGANVLGVLSETHRPVDIFISRDGTWHVQGIAKTPEKILKHVDVVFNALHGQYGEDGQVQEILGLYNIPHTGSDKFSSKISINKWLAKEYARSVGIKTPSYVLVKKEDSVSEKAKLIWNSVMHPFIVKPVRGGSSIGISIVDSYPDLVSAIESLREKDDVLVEELIKGREATCGVIDNFRGVSIYTLPPIEIIPPEMSKFFDRESKYSGQSKEISPGNFSKGEKNEIEYMAKTIHQKLGLRHYSRSDFMISPKKVIYFLEVNTLPGLTKESLFPKSLETVGSSLKDLVHHLLGLALNK